MTGQGATVVTTPGVKPLSEYPPGHFLHPDTAQSEEDE